MTLVLSGGTVVSSLDPPVVERADVAVDDGRIVSVPDGAAATSIDCSGCLIVPGNVCAHTHLYSTLARGMPFDLDAPSNFLQILQRIWWRLDRALDEESIRASALVGGLEALRCGTTTLVDHHVSTNAADGSLDIVASALEQLGIRSVLCYETSDRDGPQAAAAALRENERFLLRPPAGLVRGMVGAHASFTLSPETLAACVELMDRTGVGLHVHVAEDAADERDAEARFGMRVGMRLEAAGALREGSLLAHAVHLDAAELASVRAAGVWVAHNPTSNMNNAVGHAPVLSLGERVVLGTDGIGADMFAEARSAYVRGRDADVFFPSSWPLGRVAESARMAGRAFGESALGTLAPGAPADLVVLDATPATPLDAGNLAGHWLFGLAAGSVRDVIVNGEIVVRGRNLVNVDEQEILAMSARAAERLWERYSTIGPHPFEPKGFAA